MYDNPYTMCREFWIGDQKVMQIPREDLEAPWTVKLEDITYGIIAHGCNCAGAWGAGFSGVIGAKYPFAEKAFRSFKNPSLGRVQMVWVKPEELYIANCFTQETYGRSGVHATLDAIEKCFDFLTTEYDMLPIYAPKIGCGLGGLQWREVLPLFKAYNVGLIQDESA